MYNIPYRLKSALETNKISFEALKHRRDFTAQEAAEDTRTPGVEFAKTVFIRVDGEFAMAVLPAHHRVNLDELRRNINAREVRLATETEIRNICPDCEVGAEPPFGNLYNLPVFLSSWLTGDEYITFNAGTHEDAIRMKYQDYVDMVRPRVIDFSTQH